MIVNTKYFGEIQIDDNKKISFPRGIPAFEEINEFTLIDLPHNDGFCCLQSTRQKEVAFILIKPWNFFPNYDIHIPKEDLKELNIVKKEQVALYNIVTIPKEPNKMTANLLAPIVINMKSLTGKQIILHQEDYNTKHPLVGERDRV